MFQGRSRLMSCQSTVKSSKDSRLCLHENIFMADLLQVAQQLVDDDTPEYTEANICNEKGFWISTLFLK